jgi:hypothetical protein
VSAGGKVAAVRRCDGGACIASGLVGECVGRRGSGALEVPQVDVEAWVKLVVVAVVVDGGVRAGVGEGAAEHADGGVEAAGGGVWRGTSCWP